MTDLPAGRRSLIDVDDSILLVIDVQVAFLGKMPSLERRPVLKRICWLVSVANCLSIPIVVTAEDIAELGSIHPQLAQALPADTPIHNKMVYSLAVDAIILAAVERTGRKTAILIGLETDVCVAQSAVGLLQCGYHVVVVADATGSPGTAHAFGLQRIRHAGALLWATKCLFYEWLRTVEQTEQFWTDYAHIVGPQPW